MINKKLLTTSIVTGLVGVIIGSSAPILENEQIGNFLSSYLIDITDPISAYVFNRAFNPQLCTIEKLGLGTAVFTITSLLEFAQKYNLDPFNGTYDPKDFLAYAFGTALVVTSDIIGNAKSKK